jgi:hypothetical protein
VNDVDTQTVGMVAAVIGGLMTLVYLVLLALGVKSLRELRDQLRRPRG